MTTDARPTNKALNLEEMLVENRDEKFDLMWTLMDLRKQLIALYEEAARDDEEMGHDFWQYQIDKVDNVINAISEQVDEQMPYQCYP